MVGGYIQSRAGSHSGGWAWRDAAGEVWGSDFLTVVTPTITHCDSGLLRISPGPWGLPGEQWVGLCAPGQVWSHSLAPERPQRKFYTWHVAL